jgi:hypothetical protein
VISFIMETSMLGNMFTVSQKGLDSTNGKMVQPTLDLS